MARDFKKLPELKANSYTIAVIDQHTEAVATNQKAVCFR